MGIVVLVDWRGRRADSAVVLVVSRRDRKVARVWRCMFTVIFISASLRLCDFGLSIVSRKKISSRFECVSFVGWTMSVTWNDLVKTHSHDLRNSLLGSGELELSYTHVLA